MGFRVGALNVGAPILVFFDCFSILIQVLENLFSTFIRLFRLFFRLFQNIYTLKLWLNVLFGI